MKILFSLLFPLTFFADVCYFSPPKHWNIVKPETLSPYVEVGFIDPHGTKSRASLHLAIEEVDVSLQNYVKSVKRLLMAQAETKSWRDLGVFTAKAGKGRLTELVSESPLGPMKMLQAIFMHENKAFILTAAALESEFAAHRKEMLQSLKSLDFPKDLFTPIANSEEREAFQRDFALLGKAVEENRQGEAWAMLQKKVEALGKELGTYWQYVALKEGYAKIYPPVSHSSQ